MSTGSVGSTSNSSGLDSQSSTALNSLGSVDTSQFLQMMLAEMQNQDPLNPMSNTDLMTQLGDLQQISASNQLTSTLQAMQVGQALSNATSLIGATITGTDSTGASASGVVSQVTLSNGTPSLQVGTQTVPLANVTGVLSTGNNAAAASTLAALEQALSSGGSAAANAAGGAAAAAASAAGVGTGSGS